MKYFHHANGVQVDATQIVKVGRRRSRATPGFILGLATGVDYLTGPELPKTCTPAVGDYLGYHEGKAILFEKDMFERNYLLAGKMSFGNALQRVKMGDRIAHDDWPEGSWVCLGAAHPGLEADKFWNQHTRALAEANGGTAPVHPYFIRADAGQIQMGWVPTQSEMLDDRWHIV